MKKYEIHLHNGRIEIIWSDSIINAKYVAQIYFALSNVSFVCEH